MCVIHNAAAIIRELVYNYSCVLGIFVTWTKPFHTIFIVGLGTVTNVIPLITIIDYTISLLSTSGILHAQYSSVMSSLLILIVTPLLS